MRGSDLFLVCGYQKGHRAQKSEDPSDKKEHSGNLGQACRGGLGAQTPRGSPETPVLGLLGPPEAPGGPPDPRVLGL